MRQDYEQDPLNFPGNVRVRTGHSINHGMQRLKRHYHKVALPIFGVHGDTDRCTSLKAHQAFQQRISSKDKTLHVVQGGYHGACHACCCCFCW